MPPLPPYAELLRIDASVVDGTIRLVMPFGDDVLGRPGFLHGGAIAGLLECAGMTVLGDAVGRVEGGGPGVRLKPVNMSIDFLRGGTSADTHASAVVRRLGKRIAHVEASAWQHDLTQMIAIARMNVLLVREQGVSSP